MNVLPLEIQAHIISYLTEYDIIMFDIAQHNTRLLQRNAIKLNGYFARSGYLNCLQWSRTQKYRWNNTTTKQAAKGGYLHILKYLRECGCRWDRIRVACAAAKYGQLHCLQYIFEYTDKRDFSICHAAALNDHVNCLQYAHENGCKFHCIEDIIIEKGSLQCLKYMLKCDYKNYLSDSLCDKFAKYGHLECIQYLRSFNCGWSNWTSANAAACGHLHVLKWLHENECPWNEWTCANSAQNGHLSCLQYAHEHGCSWNTRTCTYATNYGHLDCLQYAYENKCPWHEQVYIQAIFNNHLACLMYAYENNCPHNNFMQHNYARNIERIDNACTRYARHVGLM